MGAVHAALKAVHFRLELLDDGVALLEILVETVALRDELLLPLPESLFLDLDLLGKALAESLLLFLELGVVELPRAGLSKLPSLHLLCAVCLVVVLLGGVDQVEHVRADKDGSELLEVAVFLVLNLSYTPRVLSALDSAAVVRLDILLRANDGERHGGDEAAGVVKSCLVIILKRGLVDLDALGVNDGAHSRLELGQVSGAQGVCLGNHGNQVDARAEPLHDLNVEWLQSVSGGSDEVQASVDTEIDLVATARLLLLQHVRLMLVVQELDDGLPRIAVVDIVAETGGVNNSQANYLV